MGRAGVGGKQERDRRGQVAGAAAPVETDPDLPDPARRARALPELCQQEL